jgi:uncharacterized protein (TIGR02679 family)
MTSGDRTALERLLGVPEMAWLLERARARVLAARGEPLTGVVGLGDPTDAQRAAAVRLAGRPRRPGAALRLDLAVVEEVLRRGPWPAGLADAVVTLTGPVVDTKAEREREAAAWDGAGAGLLAVAGRFPGLTDWWETWCASGGLKRSAGAEAARTGVRPAPAVGADLVASVAALLEVLPSSGEPLAVLAHRAAGDAHGLDESRPLGRLACAVVGKAFAGRELSARDAWAAAGVVLSNVASTVLCLGVPGWARDGQNPGPTRRSATAAALEAMRDARMPLVLTLDQVRAGGVPALPPDGVVHACENPTIVEVVAERWAAAAADRGGDGPVLVCTSGQPSTAVVELLGSLTLAGAKCRYHGDFDWAGLRIARALHQRVPWTPWRYTAADYVAAARHGRSSRDLTGSPAESPWDPQLAVTMSAHGLAVEEEAVADLLADDVLAEWQSRSGVAVDR